MKRDDLEFSYAKLDTKPGDVIIVNFAAELQQSALNDIRLRIARELPDVHVMVTAGVPPPEIKICRVEWRKGTS